MAWPPVPSMRSRSDAFDDLVLDAVERIERRLPQGIGDVELAVELVPPSDPAPWEPQQVPLARLFPADRGLATRVVLYRRPIETRVDDPRDLAAVVNDLVVEQLSVALGIDPLELDPGYEAVSYTHLDVYKRQAPTALRSRRRTPPTVARCC